MKPTVTKPADYGKINLSKKSDSNQDSHKMSEPNTDLCEISPTNPKPKISDTNPNLCKITANRRRQFSLEMKLKILEAIDTGKKKKDIAHQFGISQSTLSTVLKNRTKIEENSREIYLGAYRKRMRGATFRDLDKAVFVWFKDVRSRNIPVNGPRLQEKAKIIAKLLGHDNFRASGGWLSRFRERYGISTRMFDELPLLPDESIKYENFVEVDVHLLVGDQPIENMHITNNSIKNDVVNNSVINKQIVNNSFENDHIMNNSVGKIPKDNHNKIIEHEEFGSDETNVIEENQNNNPTKREDICDDGNISKSSYESDIDDYEQPETITFSQAISAFQIVKKYLFQASSGKKLCNSLKIVEENLVKTIHS